MPTQTPLTDAINALTTYANTVTGASDTTLSDAVATLAAGYGGGGTDTLDEVIRNTLTSYSNDYNGKLREQLFLNCTNLETVSFPNVWEISGGSFYNCQKLSSVNIPNVTSIWGDGGFRQCYALRALAVPKWERCLPGGATFFNATGLEILDCGNLHTNGFGNNYFVNAKLNTLIFRYNGICPLNNTGAFNSTPFANGGTGGTIYIPKALYDHLGDNSALDYKSASNWSTVDGWGTVTWAKIEGSYYETHYGDGTLIPTT